MLLYVVAYDIPCHKRRKRIADLLEGYGTRVQYSVFECRLTFNKYNELLNRLRSQISKEDDHIRFYPLSAHTSGNIEIIGNYEVTSSPTSIIV